MNEIEIEFVGSEEHIEVDPLVDDAVFPHNSYSSSPSFPTNADFPPILETGIAAGNLEKTGSLGERHAGHGRDEVDEHLAERDDQAGSGIFNNAIGSHR